MLLDAASVHFNSLHSLGTKPAADKPTPYVYLLPHCHCVYIARCFIWRSDGISEAQMPCSAYMNIIPVVYCMFDKSSA